MEAISNPEDFGRLFGTELVDFIKFEKLRPFESFADFQHCIIGIFILFISLAKLGLLGQSILFVTLD